MDRKLLIISLITLALAGCSYLTNRTKKNPPSNKHMICEQIKHQLLLPHTDPNMNIKQDSQIRKAELLRDYDRYQCEEKQQ